MASKPFPNVFWTRFVKELAVVDGNNNLLINKELFTIMLNYCINTAERKEKSCARAHIP